MICKPCAEAVANGQRGEEGHKEFGCPALNGRGPTTCDCQHREGDSSLWIQDPAAPPPMTIG